MYSEFVMVFNVLVISTEGGCMLRIFPSTTGFSDVQTFFDALCLRETFWPNYAEPLF